MRSLMKLLFAVSLAAACAACAGGFESRLPADPQKLERTLAELEQLPQPAGVDAADWAELKQALREVLIATDGQRALRGTSAAPVANSAAAQLSFDDGTTELNWGLVNPGDYDQNGEVNISDITPLAVHLGKSGPFDYGSIEAVVDGDGNGEINIADITPIGASFGSRVHSYFVFTSDDLNQLPLANEMPSLIAPLMDLPLSAALGNRAAERLHFSYTAGDTKESQFFWVRPVELPGEAGQNEGTPSNLAGPSVTESGLLPVAHLAIEPPGNLPPVEIFFDASGSSDPDGATGTISDITLFEWDFDGDGVYDESTTEPAAEHQYLGFGVYDVKLRVTDADGNTDTTVSALKLIVVLLPPPVAIINSSPEAEAGLITGVEPLTIDFDASASYDIDSDIVEYAWDFEDDSTFDQIGPGLQQVQHEYPMQGLYTCRLRVKADDGVTSEDTVDIKVSNELGLTLMVSDDSGPAPHAVTLTAQAFNPNLYALMGVTWDFEGDGVIDLDGFDTSVEHEYPAGVFYPVVRVTFGDPGNTTIARASMITATGWSEQLFNAPDADAAQAEGVMIGSLPAVAYMCNTPGQRKLVYRHSNHPYAAGWEDAVTVHNGANGQFDLANLDGLPAVAFEDNSGLYFRLANDPFGGSWYSAAELDGSDPQWIANARMVVGGGQPLVCYTRYNGFDHAQDGLWAVRAFDEQGLAWNLPERISSAATTSPSLALVDGAPALSFSQSFWIANMLNFMWAADSWAADWEPLRQVAGSALTGEQFISAVADLDGMPLIAYYSTEVDDTLTFLHGVAPDAETFAPLAQEAAPGNHVDTLSLAQVGPLLVCAYHTAVGSQAAVVLRATDASATAWEVLPALNVDPLLQFSEIVDVNGLVGLVVAGQDQAGLLLFVE